MTSNTSRPRRLATTTGVAVATGLALAVALPLPASAHVSATASSTAAGSYSLVTFAVPHGCEASPTTTIDITIPDEISTVTPTINPNWDVVKNSVTLPTPQKDAHGNTITERIANVVYTARTPLADGYRDTFTLQVKLPDDAEGKTLEFPVTQSCVEGATQWNEPTVEGENEPEHPAPAVIVTAAVAEDEHGHGADEETASEEPATANGADVLARILGIGGLVVGVIGTIVAISSRRRPKASA